MGVATFRVQRVLSVVSAPELKENLDWWASVHSMANGTGPIEASSERVGRHRLNCDGNRQPDRANHTTALAQISRPGTQGRAYCERCPDRGKTKREAIRALKRRISDRIWTHLNSGPLT